MDVLNQLILDRITLSQALYYVLANCKDILDIEFLQWLESECKGYKNPLELPDYRNLDCEVYAKYMDDFNNQHDEPIDVTAVDKYLKEQGMQNILVSKMRLSQNIESIEKSLNGKNSGSFSFPFPPDASKMISELYECPAGCNNLSIYQNCRIEPVRNILHVVKSKLINKLESTPMAKDNEAQSNIKAPLIFISHTSKDKEIIKLFVDNILKKGLNLTDRNIVFTSYEATGVVPGDNIPEYIKKNIASANIVLAMISKNYKAREVCMNEVGASWALGKTPLQIMLPNTNIDKLGWLIHLDKATKIDESDSLDSLMEPICEKMGITTPTAKHWNPCVRDFLAALQSMPDNYNKDKPECYVEFGDGTFEVECHPKFYCNYYSVESFKKTPKDTENPISVNTFMGSAINNEWIKAIQKQIVVVPNVQVSRFISKTTNLSYCKIQLYLINNSDKPIENGKVIIFADTDNIIFEKKNVEPKHGINCIIPNYRPTQSVKKNDVSESFRNPINPTATKKLYDFYVKAPSDVTEFKLNWKLESLKEPKYGSVTVKWQSEIENKWTVVKQDDERDGSSVIEDFLLDE